MLTVENGMQIIVCFY